MEANISKNTFLSNFRMRALPLLVRKFVELVGILVRHETVSLTLCLVFLTSYLNFFQKDGGSSKRDTVVLVLQDMLEVVTRDMMVNEIRSVNITIRLVKTICINK